LLDILPPEAVDLFRNFLLSPNAAIRSAFSLIMSQLAFLARGATAVINTIGDCESTPATIAVIVFGVAFVVQILFWVRRLVAWWIGLLFRCTMLALLVGLASMAHQRGWVQTGRDVALWTAKALVWAGEMVQVWLNAYDEATQAQQQYRQRMRTQGTRAEAGQRGYGYGQSGSAYRRGGAAGGW